MTRWEIETAIAEKTCAWEKANLAALGHDAIDVAMLGYGAFCGVLVLAVTDERPAVWPTPRTVTGKR
jgi:hypothetical protein